MKHTKMNKEGNYGYSYFEPNLDFEGNKIERTKGDYPYSYDEHVTWSIKGKKRNEMLTNGVSDAVYSDRIFQADSTKYNDSANRVFGKPIQNFGSASSSKIEQFLQLYYSNKELKLYKIIEGCNPSNGFPYWIFFFVTPKENE